uniref:Uncharacterized protein n=1 Tax=Oryza nivara TaxID=4536 RepID=A0A0E0FI91_ORYNI
MRARSPSAVKLRVEFCRINWSLLADHTTATGSGRQEVMSANSPASVQMVDRFAECPGLSKQQVWRVRPAVVRKKMRRKLTGAMAMPERYSVNFQVCEGFPHLRKERASFTGGSALIIHIWILSRLETC